MFSKSVLKQLLFSFLFFSFAASQAQISFDKTHYQALLKIADSSVDKSLIDNGFIIQSSIGNIRTALIPKDNLNQLAHINGILNIEISNHLNSPKLKSNIERNLTRVDALQQNYNPAIPNHLNIDGSGVIIGIVDIGFQCNHPNFYSSKTGRTRIVRYWQQSDISGPAPAQFTYGTEFKDTNVIQHLNDWDGTHGTHVAGIAAGSGISTPNRIFRGVAPEADLVFVSIKYKNDTLNGSALGDYIVANPSIIDAYKYIFDYAESVGKPAVINLSWGMHTGPHDGTSLFDQATHLLVGKGKILVGANGNEGDNPMHWNYQFNKDTVGTIPIENGRQFRIGESVYSDFWGSPKSEFSIKIQFVDTFQNIVSETPFISSSLNQNYSFKSGIDSSVFEVKMICQKENPDNLKPNITVMAEHNNQRRFAIFVYITSDSSNVHAWNSGATKSWTSGSFRNTLNQWNRSSSFIPGNNEYTAGENGGTSSSVISVGAMAARSSYYNVKNVWVNDSGYVIPNNLAKFSSRGPTVDGRIKPNVVAPGYDVPSSINNKQVAPWMLDKTLLKSVYRNDTQFWMASNGTSMAAPHVTGIVALMLQMNPDLDPKTTQNILQNTTDVEPFMGAIPNNNYGFGRVNALQAAIEAYRLYNHQKSETLNNTLLFPNPSSNFINVLMPNMKEIKSIQIVDPTGQTVYTQDQLFSNDVFMSIPIYFLKSGLYFLRVDNGGQIFNLRFVKNP
jgi:minor extracellular serine protease Vpr